MGTPSGALNLSLDDALYLLEITGAVRIDGPTYDPIGVYPITSILNLALRPELHEDYLEACHRV